MKNRRLPRNGLSSPPGPPAPPPAAARRTWNKRFQAFAHRTSDLMGTHWAFLAAGLLVTGWLISGPFFHFSETWQLVINTSTTIITFLMIFLVQATQNRESRALQLKLDELIRTSHARNVFASLEHGTDEELAAFDREFQELHSQGLRASEALQEAHDRVHGHAARDQK